MNWLLILSLLWVPHAAAFISPRPDPQAATGQKLVEMPPPNMDYFVGSWAFEWNVPDSVLGPGGKMKGIETYRKILGGAAYESEIEGEGPQGHFTGRAVTSYDKVQKVVNRYEISSDGSSTLKTGPIGGDAGGYYTIYWEATPVKKDGHVIKLKGRTLMRSPASYRLQLEISVDDGRYTSFGNPWYEKKS